MKGSKIWNGFLKNFFSLKMRPQFWTVWIIFLVLFFSYAVLISFGGKIEIRITFPNKFLEKYPNLEPIDEKPLLSAEEELEKIIDLYTDSSLQKFVSAKVSFNDMRYLPENLVSIASEYIADMKGGYQTLRIEAKEALDDLGKAFFEQFGMKLGVVSAYRSYSYQLQIKQGCGDTWCAKPGYSEHQTGLVVDIFEASNEGNWRTTPSLHKYFDWLVENAHKYGWHNTYQKGVAIDTYEVEPWHWRYLGVPLATYLHEKDITIAEYYEEIESQKKG